MRRTENIQSKERTIGSVTENPESSGKSYTLYNTCDRCPRWAYIDVVCDDKLSSLIVEGDPPEDALIQAKNDLIREFSDLSGNATSFAVNGSVKKIYWYRAQLLGLSICLQNPDNEQIVEYLKGIGLSVSFPLTEKDARRIESKIKNIGVKLKMEVQHYNQITDKVHSSTPTREGFAEQLVVLSKHVGFRLTNDITMAENAAYLKDFQTSLKHGINNAK